MEVNCKIIISQSLLNEYVDTFINSTFKVLPVAEGRDIITKKVVYNKETAYEHFQNYLTTLINEVSGSYELFENNVYYLKFLNSLKGMKDIQINEHKKLKSLVFHCIDICKKLKGDGD